ncbi:MAG TPA: helix-turn-helix domain-containing protein, partial [Rhizomicrobium sp.]|nr:helix-turn-helix domain-containing protein [Rhizomicrobium sp.]
RLNVFPVTVPALRDRAGDIAPLSRHFIERFAAEEHKQVSGITPQASQLLEQFNWPGNVRQLENTIFRAVVLCDGPMLDVCDFPQIASVLGVESAPRSTNSGQTGVDSPAPQAASPYGLKVTDPSGNIRKFEEMECEIIRMAIARYNGHMSEVARRLGIGRSTLYRKLKEFGLEGDTAEPEESSAVRKAG